MLKGSNDVRQIKRTIYYELLKHLSKITKNIYLFTQHYGQEKMSITYNQSEYKVINVEMTRVDNPEKHI